MPEVAVTTPRLASWPFLLVGAVVAALIGATLVLWAHYGAAVFFEIIAAGSDRLLGLVNQILEVTRLRATGARGPMIETLAQPE